MQHFYDDYISVCKCRYFVYYVSVSPKTSLTIFTLSYVPFRRQSCSGQITYGGKRSSNP